MSHMMSHMYVSHVTRVKLGRAASACVWMCHGTQESGRLFIFICVSVYVYVYVYVYTHIHIYVYIYI